MSRVVRIHAQLAERIGRLFRGEIAEKPYAVELRKAVNVPLLYEDNNKIDAALDVMPLDKLYAAADEREQEDSKGEWGYQDHLIMAMMKWFKEEFFQWVDTLPCSKCGSKTVNKPAVQATVEERKYGAGHAEIHHCDNCANTERFPRYNEVIKLLETHRGRCGEWANCFTFLCRSLGARVRYVVNKEDHVWTEVYSEKQKRWVHCDSCENAWDKPTLYEEGWGKRMSYCIAVSIDGAFDVTRRYVRDDTKALPRTLLSEVELSVLLDTIRRAQLHNRGIDPKSEEAGQLRKEFLEESKELASYRADKTQEVGPRESGSAEWTQSRGESG